MERTNGNRISKLITAVYKVNRQDKTRTNGPTNTSQLGRLDQLDQYFQLGQLALGGPKLQTRRKSRKGQPADPPTYLTTGVAGRVW